MSYAVARARVGAADREVVVVGTIAIALRVVAIASEVGEGPAVARELAVEVGADVAGADTANRISVRQRAWGRRAAWPDTSPS